MRSMLRFERIRHVVSLGRILPVVKYRSNVYTARDVGDPQAVPRLSTCDQVAPGCRFSSNKILLLSFPVQFFGKDNRFRKVAHRAAQAAALTSQVEIGLFF